MEVEVEDDDVAVITSAPRRLDAALGEEAASSAEAHAGATATSVGKRPVSPLVQGDMPDAKQGRSGTSSDFEYLRLAEVLEEVIQTKSRLKIVELLSNLYCAILDETRDEVTHVGNPDTLIAAVYLTTNSIAPAYEGVELGVGGHVVSQAVADATGRSRALIKQDHDVVGDLGDVAYKARIGIRTLAKPKPLTIAGVYRTLRDMAELKGAGSMQRKRDIIHKMIVSCRGVETRFLVRTLIRNLRIGAVTRTIQVALAHAIVRHKGLDVDPAAASSAIKDCYAQHPCWDSLIPPLVRGGLAAMQAQCKITPGVPISPMLGKITRDLNDVLDAFRGLAFQADFKYDGVRAQIHASRIDDEDGGDKGSYKVKLFSRHLEDMTTRYPDVIELLVQSLGLARANWGQAVSSCILDAEVVAVDVKSGTLLPFQALMGRARKDVKSDEVTVTVQVFVFDMMELNGMSLLEHSFERRVALMSTHLHPIPDRFGLAASESFVPVYEDGSHNVDDLRAFLHKAFSSRCEGLMIKALSPRPSDASKAEEKSKTPEGDVVKREPLKRGEVLFTYQPSVRCQSWLKVKKDYVEGLSDSLDLVVIGAWWGIGRKAGWFSPFLLAAYDPETEQLASVCKVMSGFTDAFYKEMTEFYQSEDRIIPNKKNYYLVDDNMRPDVWFNPIHVWEIKGADFTVSPVHKAAVGCVEERPECGISLRFPRFIRPREDKSIEDATTTQQIADMYHMQFRDGKPPVAAAEESGDEGDENLSSADEGEEGKVLHEDM